jgi:hypothetical protein
MAKYFSLQVSSRSGDQEISSLFKTTVCWYDELARSWPLGLSGGVSVALRLKTFGDPRDRQPRYDSRHGKISTR